MYKDEIETISQSALKKLSLLRSHPWGYFLAAIMAGLYVGLGAISSNVIGGHFAESPALKLLQGAVFSVALMLVLFAGAELFTGNNLVMTLAALQKRIGWGSVLLLWLVCFIGNWVGSWLTALLYNASGLLSGPTLQYIAKASSAKASLPFFAMFARGVFCNILVCLGVWAFYKLKSESGKLILIFFCIVTFVLGSFEHSVANMTHLSLAALHSEVTHLGVSGYLQALGASALGNIVGGAVCLAFPYWFISFQKD